MAPIPRTSAIGSRVAPKRTVKRPAAAKAAAAAEEEEAEEEEKAEVAKAGLAKERQRSKGLTGSGGRVAEAAGKKRMPKASVGSSGADTETASKKPRHTAPADCAGQKEDKSSAPTALDGLTDSGGSCTHPPPMQYLGDGSTWVRDPRLRSGEMAEQRGWQRCECNGFCGRKSCPGRKDGYYQERKKRVGCPNPALAPTQVRPRCASCSCRFSGCDQNCNATGFCRRHRKAAAPGMKRPAAAMSKWPTAAPSSEPRPARR